MRVVGKMGWRKVNIADCVGDREPNYEETGSSTKSAFMRLIVDGLLSFGLDTVALPYTVTRQIEVISWLTNADDQLDYLSVVIASPSN
jgi:hypothetical protein